MKCNELASGGVLPIRRLDPRATKQLPRTAPNGSNQLVALPDYFSLFTFYF